MAIINDVDLVLDDVSGFAADHDYQRRYQLNHFNIPCRHATRFERLEPLARLRRFLKRAISRWYLFEERSYIMQDGIDFDVRLLTVKPNGTLYLEGYWQSEQYFKDVESLIRNDLHIIPPVDDINQSMAEQIRNCQAVAVHVRFFDAPQELGVSNAPPDYYDRAVAKMETMTPGAHYFIFSDQPAAAFDLIQLPSDRITLVGHNKGDDNAYADLWLMAQCQHFIIANSTFSWWGAWLSERPGKQIIAPGYENRVGKTVWGFTGLLPKEWIKL